MAGIESEDILDEVDKSNWPKGVSEITWGELSLLGVNRKTNELYFDGRAIQFQNRLALFERVLATLGVASAVAVAIVEIGRSFGWWGG